MNTKRFKQRIVHGFVQPVTRPTCQHLSLYSVSSGIESSNPFEVLSDSKELPENIPGKRNHKYTNKVSIVSININGLRGKKLELQAYLATESPDIVALQETKIDSSIKSNELIPDSLGYDIFRNDRTGKCGGTMLLVNHT